MEEKGHNVSNWCQYSIKVGEKNEQNKAKCRDKGLKLDEVSGLFLPLLLRQTNQDWTHELDLGNKFINSTVVRVTASLIACRGVAVPVL